MSAPGPDQPVLEVTDLKKHFPVEKGVLRRVVAHVKAVDGDSFTIKPGETLCLVGESGCGKSTVGKLALGLIPATAGSIRLHGTDITDGYHNLSHHGKSSSKLKQLEAIDQWHMRLLDQLFSDLKGISENGETLFDRTMVLYGSNLGNANTHVTTNLPVLLAGGGFRHGQHLAFDTQNNYPLPNLFVSMLQRMGLPAERFATSTGTMRGLEG